MSRSSVLMVSASALAVIGPALLPMATRTAPAAPAPAASSWGPVKVLTRNPRGESLVVDAHNALTVVWANWAAPHRVVAQRRAPRGAWGARSVLGHGSDPRVATDAHGDLLAVWITHRRGWTDGVALSRRPHGGQWTEPVRLTHDVRVPGYVPDAEGPYGAAHVSLAMSPRGAAVVAWDWGSEDRHKAWRIVATHRPAGGGFAAPTQVTAANGSTDPQVGISSHGDVTLLFERWRGTVHGLLSARLPVGGGWTTPTTAVREGFDPSLAVDRQGRAVLVYTPNFNRVQAVRRPARGDWSTARVLSPRGARISSFALAMNPRGTALVAMARPGGRVDVRRRPPTGPWSGSTTVGAGSGPAADVVVALNESGAAFVGWGEYALNGAFRPAGGSWSTPFVISPDAGVEVLESLHAVVAPGGGVAALWKQESRPLKVRWMTAAGTS